MATCSAQELLSTAKCFACLTIQQLACVRISLLCQILQSVNPMASCDVQSLIEASKCYQCLDVNQRSLIQTQLLCEILNAGGTSGSSCLLCGNVDPIDEPSCECALYYNRASGSFWYWDSAIVSWVEMIGGP